MDRNLLSAILKDAKVVDVDLSEWDRCVRLAVVALAEERVGRYPVYVLEFYQVSEFAVVMNHDPAAVEGTAHQQWCSDEFTIDSVARGFRVVMRGSSHMPATTIVSRDCSIREVSSSALDKAFPDWNRPGSPHIRPGIETWLGPRSALRRTGGNGGIGDA
jgi:hypothetical protein